MHARPARIVLAILILLAGLATRAEATDSVPGYSVTLRQSVAAGVEHLHLVSSTPEDVHVAHLLPGSGIRLSVVESHGLIAQSRTNLQRPDALCRAVNCLVAVNGDFINGSAQPYGGVAVNGVLLRSPGLGHQQFWVGTDGGFGAGWLGFSGRVADRTGAGFAVTGLNADRGKDSVTVYTSAYGTKTPKGKGLVELVARAVDPSQVARLGSTASLSLLQVKANSTGGTPIAPGTVVISGQGKGGSAQVQALWDRRAAIGSAATLSVDTSPRVQKTIGVNPVVLLGGRRVFPGSGSFITGQQPRTLFAWNPAGDAWLITVDGRQPSSKGWTIAEAADFAARLGATSAVNFDGGGGTTFVVQGNIVNRPSDNAKPGKPGTVRGAANVLAVVPAG